MRRQDLNLRPSGYEPDELPYCSTPRHLHFRLASRKSRQRLRVSLFYPTFTRLSTLFSRANTTNARRRFPSKKSGHMKISAHMEMMRSMCFSGFVPMVNRFLAMLRDFLQTSMIFRIFSAGLVIMFWFLAACFRASCSCLRGTSRPDASDSFRPSNGL